MSKWELPEVRHAYSKRLPEGEDGSVRCTEEEKRTVESAADETDINVMLRRLSPGMVLPVAGGAEAFYGDVSEVGDFRSAVEVVQRAEEAFMAQPAELRKRFDNDAAKFLDFVSDEKNRKEAVELGLIVEQRKSGPRSERTRKRDLEAAEKAALVAAATAAAKAPGGS